MPNQQKQSRQESPKDKYSEELRPPFNTHNEMQPPGVEENLNPAPRFIHPNYKGADKLLNKVAIITGGDSGIGRAIAVHFAREGADIVFTYLPEEKVDADRTKELIQKEGRQVLALSGDLKDFEYCERIIQSTIEKFGKVDILVNNAAYQEHIESIDDLSIEHWDKTFKTNIYGYFYMVKAATSYLKPGAAIINISSVTALQGSGALLDYSSTKGAIEAFTKSLAQQFLERGIRVNAIAPGPIWTPLNPAEKKDVSHFGESVPYGRPGQPEEIAPAAVFLASNIDSSYITGLTIKILGGEIAGS